MTIWGPVRPLSAGFPRNLEVGGAVAPACSVGSVGRSWPGSAVFDHAAQVGRLPGVLEVVGEHAHQAHTECHRRIPA